MIDKNNNTTSTKRLLPDFCSARTVLTVMLIGELLAIVLTLRDIRWSVDSLIYLAYASLFIQWIALTDIAVLCYGRRVFGGFNTRTKIISAFIGLQIVTLLISEIGYRIVIWVDLRDYPADFHWHLLVSNLFISIIITAIAFHYFWLQTQSISRLHAETNAKIEALQARIRPHFLFNSLNTIANLIHADPDTAEEAIIDLSELFRSAMGKQDAVSLNEEMELTRRYVNMEKLRLGERLNVHWSMPSPLPMIRLPALMVQPLVENAIYHGVEPMVETGNVFIELERTETHLEIHVRNPVPNTAQIKQRRKGNKIALNNIRQRMTLSYGTKGDMIIKHDDKEHQVILKIPLDY